MLGQLGSLGTLMSARSDVCLNNNQARVMANWLLVHHTGRMCSIYRFAASIVVGQPIDRQLALSAVSELLRQHDNRKFLTKQVVVANAIAGLLTGVPPAEVMGKTVEFFMAKEA